MIERYTRPVLKELWSDQTKFNMMLKVELAAASAYHILGVIPDADFLALQKASFSLPRVHEIEEETKHDVIAFTRAVSESLGSERKWIHYNLTSTDVVDTAQALILRSVNEILLQGIDHFCRVLKDLALSYKDTPTIGRTHGMHAEVTSFGLKWLNYYDEMQRNRRRFLDASAVVEVGKISGAVGNFANLPPEIETLALAELHLPSAAIATQVLSRDRHHEYMYALASLASTLEKIATEVRHLSRTEIGEVQEDFIPGQKGSSAMPHKKNPITSETICGLSRVIRAYLPVAFENNILWHERDISHSSAERVILADATTLMDYLLVRYAKTLSKIHVDSSRMLDNIHLTYGIIFSGKLVSALIQTGWSREESYDFVQHLTAEAFQTHTHLRDVFKSSPAHDRLDDIALTDVFDLSKYLLHVDEIYHRVLGGSK
jgi:adenylosuccinate lyase